MDYKDQILNRQAEYIVELEAKLNRVREENLADIPMSPLEKAAMFLNRLGVGGTDYLPFVSEESDKVVIVTENEDFVIDYPTADDVLYVKEMVNNFNRRLRGNSNS